MTYLSIIIEREGLRLAASKATVLSLSISDANSGARSALRGGGELVDLSCLCEAMYELMSDTFRTEVTATSCAASQVALGLCLYVRHTLALLTVVKN